MKKQIWFIQCDDFDNLTIETNKSLNRIDYEKFNVRVEYIEGFTVMIETTEKGINPLLELINKNNKENSNISENQLPT